MSATYFDEVAAKFFEPALRSGRSPSDVKPEAKFSRYTIARDSKTPSSSDKAMPSDAASTSSGCALGPHWLSKLKQTLDRGKKRARNVHIVNHVEVRSARREKPPEDSLLRLPEDFTEVSNWPLWVEFTNGKTLGCDLVIQATGVTPNSDFWKRDCPQLALAEDGGILVSEMMETNVADVFAAGDVCTAGWTQTPHWTQIRLWTQARQMGMFAARCMVVSNVLQDIAFDIFTHVTTFFGFKVVLLGDFSGSRLEQPFEVHFRITKGHEYVKVLTKDSRVHGAVLIGDTDLEETIENLILDQVTISDIEKDLLNPNVDLEDYFD
ncbi:pyridine nucleotide-disufhide oxidoreductase [Aphelenchoides avenae]|nr:pyridine nucleotide-disufhide oxidoreductase [Aphelenchus avenae]